MRGVHVTGLLSLQRGSGEQTHRSSREVEPSMRSAGIVSPSGSTRAARYACAVCVESESLQLPTTEPPVLLKSHAYCQQQAWPDEE